MDLSGLAMPTLNAAPMPRALDGSALDPANARQRDFASILSRQFDRPGETPDPEAQATDAARQLVAITLVQPVLAQLRETSQAAPPFAPTQAERQFRALADAQLAQEIVRATRFPLVERLARDMLARTSGGGAATDKEVRT